MVTNSPDVGHYQDYSDRSLPAELSLWRAYHIFYHDDQNCVLSNLVSPLSTVLLARNLADRDYFVRYCLGGPHVRFRIRLTGDDNAAIVRSLVAEAIERFLASSPSLSTLPHDRVLAMNASLIASDPANRQEMSEVVPNNSWRQVPPQFEIIRYGGPELFDLSLTCFEASSACVLAAVTKNRISAPGWARNAWFRIAVPLAAVMTQTHHDFSELLAYHSSSAGVPFSACVEQGDIAFVRQSEAFQDFMLASLGQTPSAEMHDLLKAASHLKRSLRAHTAASRTRTVQSHLHMTANRLGISNAEEAYLSRLLWRTACELSPIGREAEESMRFRYDV